MNVHLHQKSYLQTMFQINFCQMKINKSRVHLKDYIIIKLTRINIYKNQKAKTQLHPLNKIKINKKI